MKKWTSLVLALLMMLSLLPGAWAFEASAADEAEISLHQTHINPIYAGVISEADLTVPSRRVLKADGEEIEYVTTVEDAGEVMRDAMKLRQEEILVYLETPYISNDALLDLAYDISDAAMIHTGVPTEGDYLLWQYAGWEVHIGGTVNNGTAFATYTFTVTYYTSAQQEAEVDAAVAELLDQLNAAGSQDEDKIRAVYDYICANVVYDYDHVNDTSYKTQYTAYGALIDGTSVCQGYAVLLYRLALELDVDARLIAGTGGGEAHGWNIVKLGDVYYNADSTWDAGETAYSYYLKSDDDFDGHVRYDEYATESFYEAYPMSEENYSGCAHSYGTGEITKEPTCTAAGTMTYTCGNCGSVRTEEINALGHSYDDGAVTKEPTCTEAGTMSYACGNCGKTYTEEIAAAGHSWTDQVTQPTCTAEGYTTHTCANCGETYTDSPTEKLPHDYVNGKCTVCGAEGAVRISGQSRYETSLLIADALKQELGFARFDTIVVASGENFADALAGSYLANRTNAPILLANSSNADAVKTYIRENLAVGGTVYLLGGENALPAVLETGLSDYTVKRLAGDDRFETNLKILQEAGAGNQEFLVCTGSGFADSLSASAVRKPILLVGKTLNEDQKKFLESSGGSFTIIGGENSVSAAVAEELSSYGTVERIGGASRYETSVLIAKRYFAQPQAVVLASALAFPDGLCGGPLAFTMGAPLILTAADNETAAADYVAEQGVTRGVILGGTAMISDASIEIIFK